MSAPVITSPHLATGSIGFPFSYQIVADNAPTSFSAGSLPAGITCDPTTGLISGKILASGVFSCTMTATNADGDDTQPLTISFASGTKPVFTSDPFAYAIANVPFSFTVHATNNPTYSAQSLPSWLTLDSVTGVLSGTPPAGLVQTYSLKIRATLTIGSSSTDSTLTLSVSADGGAPVITSDDSISVITGAPVNFQLTATNNPTNWSLELALPAGLTLDHGTGLISGTPLVPQVWKTNVHASNASGDGLQLLYIYISDGGVAQKPVITSLGTVTAPTGQPLSYQITALNNPTSFGAAGTLPVGVSFNTNTGRLYGIPTVPGTYSIKQIAINASGQDFEFFTLIVANSPATPSITSAETANGTSGQGFSYFITGTNSPTTYDATGLPAGLHINQPVGLITGTLQGEGIFNINLRAINGAGQGAGVLVLTVGAGNTPAITSDLNVIGTTGLPFNYQITATNNPTSFEANPTDLAAAGDLTIDGVTGAISGTLGAPGTYPIRLTAHNDFGRGDSTLTLGITDVGVPVTPVVTSPNTAAGVVGFGFQYQITGTNSPFLFTADGLPEGVSLNPTTGLIYGTPLTAGSYTVLVGAGNDFGTGTLLVTVTIQDAPVIGDIVPSPAIPDPEGAAPVRVDVQMLRCVAKLRYVEKQPEEQMVITNIEALRLEVTAILLEQDGKWDEAAKAEAKAEARLQKELREYLAGVDLTPILETFGSSELADLGIPL